MVGLLRRFQTAIDAYFLHTYYQIALRQEAFRAGSDKGLIDDALKQFVNESAANPSEKQMALARDEADRLLERRAQRLGPAAMVRVKEYAAAKQKRLDELEKFLSN